MIKTHGIKKIFPQTMIVLMRSHNFPFFRPIRFRLNGIRRTPSLAVFNSGKQGTTVHTLALLLVGVIPQAPLNAPFWSGYALKELQHIPPTFRPPCVECISLVRHLNADSQYFCQYSQDHASNVNCKKRTWIFQVLFLYDWSHSPPKRLRPAVLTIPFNYFLITETSVSVTFPP